VITPLRILCVAGCVGSAIAGATVLYDAMGRPDTVAMLAALRFAVVVPLLAVGATVAGVVGAAWAMVATACVTQVFNWCVVKSRLDLSGKEIRRHFTRPVVATAIMVLAVLAVQDVLPDGGSFASSLFRLVAGIVAGGLVYVLSL
jgi:PST family polysaccharide transporter